ncbi:MAG: ABC transporter substrate-binding protein [Mycetocola sp.]
MRSTRSRILAAMAAFVVVTTGLAGCGGGDDSGDGGGGDDSTQLTLGMTADLTGGWDIIDQPPFQSWGIEAVYDTVVRCVPGGELIPAAAESWEISDDRKSFTAQLREGMTYSDGSAVDAASVQKSFEVVKETASDRYGDITFDIPDERTITISWPEPQPLIELRMCAPYLASIEYLDQDAADRKTAPVGSGPYTYDESGSTAGSIYKLEKNPDNWNADAYPYQTLELRVLADEAASVNALKTGQIDGTVITPATYQEVKDSGLDIISNESGMLMIHLTDRLGQVIPALGDVRVRQAMNMVIDKQQVVDQLWDGLGTPIWQPFGIGHSAYLADLEEPYPYDVEAAKALMAEAGYQDGFTLTVPTMEGQPWTVLLPYLTQQLGELNITVEQDALSGPDAIATLISGDYPVPVWIVGSPSSVEDITVHILDTGFWNVLHQPNETVNQLWEQIVTGDEQQSIDAQQEINRYVVEQAWFVPILSPQNHYAYNSDAVTIDEVTQASLGHPALIDFQ